MKCMILMFILGMTLCGCATNTQTGALVGTGVGAGVGAAISPTPAGVLIGAGAGAATGALIGSALDSSDKDNIQRNSPDTRDKIDKHQQLTKEDIITMSNAGVTDDKIIGTIHSTGSVFHLNANDVQELKDAGVSQRVIDAMLKTAY